MKHTFAKPKLLRLLSYLVFRVKVMVCATNTFRRVPLFLVGSGAGSQSFPTTISPTYKTPAGPPPGNN